MSYLVIVIIILAILVALIVAHRLSMKEKRMRELQTRAKRILVRANEIWDLTERLSLLIEAPDIQDALLEYYAHQIRQRDDLIDTDDSQEYFARIDQFKSRRSTFNITNQLKNDAEINQAKRCFSQASKLLRASHKIKIISGQACNSMRTALRRRLLDLEVDAHERLGDAAGERNDPAIATNHYKYAKKLLIESDLKFEGKNERVASITHKNQVLFGNAVAEKLSKGLDEEADTHDEFGIPKDLDVMAGNKKTF